MFRDRGVPQSLLLVMRPFCGRQASPIDSSPVHAACSQNDGMKWLRSEIRRAKLCAVQHPRSRPACMYRCYVESDTGLGRIRLTAVRRFLGPGAGQGEGPLRHVGRSLPWSPRTIFRGAKTLGSHLRVATAGPRPAALGDRPPSAPVCPARTFASLRRGLRSVPRPRRDTVAREPKLQDRGRLPRPRLVTRSRIRISKLPLGALIVPTHETRRGAEGRGQ